MSTKTKTKHKTLKPVDFNFKKRELKFFSILLETKNGIWLLPHFVLENQSQGNCRLNADNKTIKLLEENLENGFKSWYLEFKKKITQKSLISKKNIYKSNFIKAK